MSKCLWSQCVRNRFEEPHTANLCEIGGEITLDPHIPLSQQNNATITWFEGEGSSPTQLSAGNFTQVIKPATNIILCVLMILIMLAINRKYCCYWRMLIYN